MQAWAADPDHLAGRIVITKGPVPTRFQCVFVLQPDAPGSPGGCQVAAEFEDLAPEGYWAVSVGADGQLSIGGELTLTQAGGFAFTVDELSTDPGSAGQVRLVYGILRATKPTWEFESSNGHVFWYAEMGCPGACPSLPTEPAYYLIRLGPTTELLSRLEPYRP